MLPSKVYQQQAPKSLKNSRKIPTTRRIKPIMSQRPPNRESADGATPSKRLNPITGTPDRYEIERNFVMLQDIDYNRTGWTQIESLMHTALKREDQPLLKVIVSAKSLDTIDNDPTDITLWSALQMDEIEVAKTVIDAGTDLNRRHPGTEMTYLHWLVTKTGKQYNNLAMAIMDYGADVNAVDKMNNSVLHVAAEFGPIEMVAELIYNRHANIDVVNKNGHSVIYASAKCPRTNVMDMLIECAKDIPIRNKRCYDAFYALFDLKVTDARMRSLLRLKFPLDQYGRRGGTFLYEAVLEKRVGVVKLLLEYGADLNRKLRNGKLPLHAAVQQKDLTLVKILLEHGSDIHRCSDDYNGQYPLHAACRSDSLVNIKLLLRLGADVTVTDKNGRTPFSLMSNEKFGESHEWLIRHIAISSVKGITINKTDKTKIYGSVAMQEFYEKCVAELQEMKTINITHKITLFNLFERPMLDIAPFIRPEVIRRLENSDKSWPGLGPMYYHEIQHLIRQTILVNSFLEEREDVVLEISRNALPDFIVKLISDYSCCDEVREMQRNYYYSCADD